MTSDLVDRANAALQNLDPIAHLQKLDFPRRAGTDGDRQGAEYIAGALRAIGIEPAVQEFRFSKPKFLSTLTAPLVLLAWMLLSLTNIRFWGSNPIVSLIVVLLVLALIVAILNMDRLMRCTFARQRRKLAQVDAKLENGQLCPDQVLTSQNVIAEIGPADADRQFLFTAHLDSISSKIPMQVMTTCIGLGLLGVFLYSIAYLVNLITVALYKLNFIRSHLLSFAIPALIALALLEVAMLSRLFRGNESHGVIDDGTGVAILLELAKLVKEYKLNGRYTFAFFGAEEAGLIGSAYYYTNRLDGHRPHVISIDMIGERPPLAYVKAVGLGNRLPMGADFNAQIESIAQAFDIQIRGRRFPYPGSDFAHFALDGHHTTNWLISGSRLIHSRHDTFRNLKSAPVKDALKLLVAFLLQPEQARSPRRT